MTIPATTSRISYVGDNVSTVFNVPFLFFANTDLLVTKVAVGGAISTLVLAVDYNLSGAGNVLGGTLTKTTPLLTGETMQIILSPPITQLSHYVQNQPFPTATVETNFDKLTQICQRLQDEISRSLRAPDADVSTGTFLLPAAAARALTYPSFDLNGAVSLAQSLPSGTLSAASIGGFLYPVVVAEGTTVVNIQYPYGWTPRYGAKVDNVTDDTTAITNACASGFPVYFPTGTSVSSSNITGFHAALKYGPGLVKRGSDIFTVVARTTSTNKLYHATTGSDSNDGLSSSQPFLTRQAVADAAFKNYGPVLQGNWICQSAAGTYPKTDTCTMQPSYLSANAFQFNGPSGALPFVPTAIGDGTGCAAGAFWLAMNGQNFVLVQNWYLQNWANGGTCYGMNNQTFGQLQTNNVYGLNNDTWLKVQQGRTNTIGGVVRGGVTGANVISGETHTFGYTATNAFPLVVPTAAGGDGTTATLTIPVQASAPIVGGWAIVRAFTGAAAGYNGVYQVTASTTTSISYLNATTAALAGSPQLTYNGGCAGYGTMFADQSQNCVLMQENATGHFDDCVASAGAGGPGIDIVCSSRANCNTSTFFANGTANIRIRESASWANNGCTLDQSGVLCYTNTGDINRTGAYTSARRAPIDLTFNTQTGVLAATTIKTYTNDIDWANGFNTPVKSYRMVIYGTITGVTNTKNITVQLDGSSVWGFSIPAGQTGDFVMEGNMIAASVNGQSYGASFIQNGQTCATAQGSRAITLTAGTVTIQETINGAGDTISIRSVIREVYGGA